MALATHGRRRGLGGLALGAALAAALVGGAPRAAHADSQFLVVPPPGVSEASPAYRYAHMTNDEAYAELDKRKILYTKVPSAPGVRAPIRLTGKLHGVYVHGALPPEQRITSVFEILDARLALALDDFCALLERHEIDELVHFTMYRPQAADTSKHGVDDKHTHGPTKAPAKPSAVAPAPRGATAAPKPVTKPSAAKAPAKSPTLKGGALKAPVTKGAAGLPTKPMLEKAPDTKAPELVVDKAKAPSKAAPPAPSTSLGGKPVAKAQAKAQVGKAPAAKGPALKSQAKVEPQVARPRAGTPTKDGPREAKAVKVEPPKVPEAPVKVVKPAPPGTRHPAGLAIDVGKLRKRSGQWLSVAGHFHGKIGDRTCGDGAKTPDTPEARELRSIVCEASDLRIFTYTLTPNYDAAHVDHYHMEIKPGVRWFLYH